MKKEKIIIILAVIVFMLLLMVICYNKMQEINKTIERCKDKGWDGVEFPDRFSNKVICSNYTQAEKDAISGDKE